MYAHAIFNLWHAVDEPPVPYLVKELDGGGYGVVDTDGRVCTKFSIDRGDEELRFDNLTDAMAAGLDYVGFSFTPTGNAEAATKIAAAAANVAATFTNWADLANHFRCVEADAMAELLVAVGSPIEAHHLIAAHREADDRDDSDHRAIRGLIEEEAPNGRCDECGAPCNDTGCVDSEFHMVAMDRDNDPDDALAWAERVSVKAAAKRLDMASRAFFGSGLMGARYVWVHSAEDGSQRLAWANRVDGSADNEINGHGCEVEYENDVCDALASLRRDNLALWAKAVTKTTTPYVTGEPTFDPDWTLFRAPYGDESMARLDLRVLAAIAR